MDSRLCSSLSDVEFASADEEDEEDIQPTRRRDFQFSVSFSTLKAAKAGIDTFDTNAYKFAYNYGKKGHGERVYKCVSHHECAKRLRLAKNGDGGFKIEHAGAHGGDVTNMKNRGIHGTFIQEVGGILLGCGPKKCRKILQDRYAEVPQLSALLPGPGQLKNHKSHLKSALAGGWEIKNIAKLLEWAFSRLCSSRAEFFLGGVRHINCGDFDAARDAEEFYTTPNHFRNELMVLECFEHDVPAEEGTKATCFGLVITSRQIFRNVLYAHNGQKEDDVVGVTDGTYRIHLGGWTLVDFGTYTTYYDRNEYRKMFVPWVYMFVQTEHQAAYSTMFSSVRRHAKLFFGIDLLLSYGSLDRMSGIANAYAEVLPEIALLNCYPHFSRKSRENRGRLVKSEFYETNMQPNILYLVEARSKKQFDMMTTLFLSYWRAQGEGEYADWMEQYYMGNVWGNWFYTAAIPGLTPSQNALESHHKVIKKPCQDSLRASTSVVLNDSLPRILKHQEEQPVKMQLRHFCEGPLIGAEVEHTQHLLLNTKNYYSIKVPYTKEGGLVFEDSRMLIEESYQMYGKRESRSNRLLVEELSYQPRTTA